MTHGRPAAPVEVRAVFAPTERECPHCRNRSSAPGRDCPACGAPYVDRRAKPLSSARVRLTLAVVLIALAAVIVAGVIALSPGIDRSKSERAVAARRAEAAAMAAIVRHDAAQQTLHTATGQTRVAGPAAPPATRLAQRTALVSELERAITADARARVRAGSMTGPILYTTCAAYPAGAIDPKTLASARLGDYQCLVVNVPVKNRSGVVGSVGDPFWARVDFARSAFAWCMITPRAGEMAIGSNVPTVPLSRLCDLSVPPPAGF
jgi:hypothetical protein